MAKWQVRKTHNPLSRWDHTVHDNPCIYGNSRLPVFAWIPHRGLLEEGKTPSHSEQSWEGTQQLISAGHLQEGLCKFKIVGSFLHGSSQEEQGTPFRNCWPSSKCKGTWERWAHLSRPSALGFLADALFRKEEGRADGWFADGLKILPGTQKAGWLLLTLLLSATRSHEGWAQLGD